MPKGMAFLQHFLIVIVAMAPTIAKAELRAFQLKITDSQNGTERMVVSRFDHMQYPMYFTVKKSEVVEIHQTWMCWNRSDYAGSLCAPPAEGQASLGQSAP